MKMRFEKMAARLAAVVAVLLLAGSAPSAEEKAAPKDTPPPAAKAPERITPANRRIVGGESTDIRQHPWQVASRITVSEVDKRLCGGSIIQGRWVLTAAHCFAGGGDRAPMRAKAGVTRYLSEGEWVDVERIVVHEGYDPATLDNDIALVKLASPPPAQSRSVALARADMVVPTGEILEVTGWGYTSEDGIGSGKLLLARVPVVDRDTCNGPESYDGRVPAGAMCAGYREGGVDACSGDSGGPLVWRSGGTATLVGVVSSGDGCARALKYGLYTRVSAHRPWISRVLASDPN